MGIIRRSNEPEDTDESPRTGTLTVFLTRESVPAAHDAIAARLECVPEQFSMPEEPEIVDVTDADGDVEVEFRLRYTIPPTCKQELVLHDAIVVLSSGGRWHEKEDGARWISTLKAPKPPARSADEMSSVMNALHRAETLETGAEQRLIELLQHGSKGASALRMKTGLSEEEFTALVERMRERGDIIPASEYDDHIEIDYAKHKRS